MHDEGHPGGCLGMDARGSEVSSSMCYGVTCAPAQYGCDCLSMTTWETCLCPLMILVTISPTSETVSPTGNVSSFSVCMTCSRSVVGGMSLRECSMELWLSMSI